jgi:hypothetical protein
MINLTHLNGVKKLTIAVDVTENKLKTHIKFDKINNPYNIISLAY